jgi:hypothetical protein
MVDAPRKALDTRPHINDRNSQSSTYQVGIEADCITQAGQDPAPVFSSGSGGGRLAQGDTHLITTPPPAFRQVKFNPLRALRALK